MVKLGTRNHGHRTVTWKGATPCGSFWTLTFKGINNEKLDGYQDRRCGRLRCAGWLHRPEAAAGGYRQPEEPGGHAVLRRGRAEGRSHWRQRLFRRTGCFGQGRCRTEHCEPGSGCCAGCTDRCERPERQDRPYVRAFGFEVSEESFLR